MKKEKLPLTLHLVQGAIGKKFVIKHYAYGVVKTKFPDMTQIEPTPGQTGCRSRFKEAVSFAKAILQDRKLKQEWQQKLAVKKRLYNALVKYYMNNDGAENPTR